jgi:adenosine deaminase
MSIESYLRAIPKVELDIQLEGTIRKETLLTIAEQNEISENLKQFKQWMSLLDNPDYQRLDELIQTITSWLQTPEDLSRVVYELGVSLAKQNVRYAEVHVDPLLYMENNNLTFEQFLNALNDGRNRSERAWHVRMGWILDVPRDQPRKSDDILRWVTSAAAKKGGVVGMALMGREDIQPLGQFERPFKTAQKKDIQRAVQAGAELAAEGILDALQQLEPDRVIDGWGTADAPDVIGMLTERGIPLSICVARALCLGRAESYASFPLRELYDDGITLTINSGMPSLYRTTLVDEYLALIEHNDFGLEEVEEIALNSVRASWLPEEEKQVMLQEFIGSYSELRAEHNPAARTLSP